MNQILQKLLKNILFFLVLILLVIGFFHPITAINQDLGRHLLLGEIILQTHHIPTTNLLSYTNTSYPFVNSHWLSEVIFSVVYQVGGFNLLLIFSILITIVSFLIIFFYTAKHSSLISSIIVGSLYEVILLERSDVRPEIFSFLFLSLFTVILYKFRSTQTKLIFLLIPLEILWVNMHIYFIAGIFLIFLFLIEQLIKTKFYLNNSINNLGQVFVLTSLATLINPNGINGALFPFLVPQNIGIPILENQNIFLLGQTFHPSYINFFELAIVLLFVCLILTRKQTPIINWLLFIFFTFSSILVVRNFPLFVFPTFIAFASSLNLTLKNLNKIILKLAGEKNLQLLNIYSLLLGVLLLVVMIAKIASTQSVGFGISDSGQKAVEFFKQNKLHGPIYNNFDIGSYLAFRLYPQEKIFIDGRPEAYPKEFLQKIYLPMQDNPIIFSNVANKYHFNTFIIAHYDQTPFPNPLLKNLLHNKNYTLIYLDDYAVILVRNTKANQKLIQKYVITESSFKLPKNLTQDEKIRYLYFFKKVGWKSQEKYIIKLSN